MFGYLEGGLASMAAAKPELTATTERVSALVAAEQLERGGPLAIDVRAPHERAQKAIAGSLHLPLSQLRARAGELPRDRPLFVYCAGGYRSSIAASLLQSAGFDKASELAGGIAAWESAKLPVVHG